MPHAHRQSEIPRFMQRQYEFARRIRDPQHAPAPGDVPTKRMAAYEELFYNNINECLSNAFPVLRTLHDDEGWHALVRDYFARHHAHTPLFHEMPREFLLYLQQERGERDGDCPFLQELAHYEWIELELLTAEEALPEDLGSGEWLNGRTTLSPLARLLSYHYPVHRIGPDSIPQHPTPTYLLVYRDHSDVIGFMELNPVSARLLQLVDEKPQASVNALLEQIATELEHPNPQTVIDGGLAILDELQQRGIVLASRSERR